MKTDSMLSFAAGAVGSWLFFATVTPAAVLSGMTVTWWTVRSSLSLPSRSRRLLLPMIVMIVAAGLAGCAGPSDRHVQFFKAYGAGQVEPRYLGVNIIEVSQTDQAPSSPGPSRRDK